jgi:hypothetical protein
MPHFTGPPHFDPDPTVGHENDPLDTSPSVDDPFGALAGEGTGGYPTGDDPDLDTGSGGRPDDLADPTDWYEDFLKNFPGWAELVANVPELKGIIETWWETGVDEWDYNAQYNGLLSAIQGSNWWGITEEPLRDYLLLQSSDPATWAKNNEITRQNAMNAASELGLDFAGIFNDPKYRGTKFFEKDYYTFLSQMAEKNDWTLAQIKDRLVRDGLAMDTTPVRGSIKRDMDRIISYGKDMLIDISPSHARTWAHRMGSEGGFFSDAGEFQHGAMGWDDVKDTIQGLASAEWDWLDIDGLAERGLTVADTLSTVKSTIASTLELNPENINLMGIGIDNLTKGEGEGRRFINKNDAESWAKRQSMYQGTDKFRKDVRTLGGGVNQLFGRGGGFV